MSKVKRILILYLNNGDMKEIHAKELMWKTVMNEFVNLQVNGTIATPSNKRVDFSDGTIVEMVPINSAIGRRVTHLYVSKNIDEASNGEEMVKTIAYTLLLPNENYDKWDTENKEPKERLSIFSVGEDGKIITE